MEMIAKRLADYMTNNGESVDNEVLKFGIQMFFELLINLIISFFVAGILDMWLPCCLFLILFSILRAFAGGIHLNSFISCTVLSTITLSSVMLIIKYLTLYVPISMILILILIFMILIWYQSPIEDSNRPLSKEERIIFKNRLRVSLIIIGVICCFLYYIHFKKTLFLFCLTKGLMVAVLFFGKRKNVINNRIEE